LVTAPLLQAASASAAALNAAIRALERGLGTAARSAWWLVN
jgi:hypothetical protein